MKKLIIFFLIFISFTNFVFANFTKKVLVVESYHHEYAWDKSYSEGLKEVIPKNVELIFFEMNTKRLPKDQHQKMANLAWSKYLEVHPDLIILGDDAALKLLGERFAQTKLPVVYLGINNNPRNYFKEIPNNLTGILERPYLKYSVNLFQTIIPTSKKCLILFDTDITSQIVKSEVFGNNDTLKIGSIEVDIKLVKDINEWKNLVINSKLNYDFLIIGLYQTIIDNNNNQVMNPEDVVAWTSANGPIPLFGFWDFSIGKNKTIGGMVLYGKDMGKAAGNIVNDIFNGKKVESISPVFNDQGILLFSQFELNKWKIKLPENIVKKATMLE